MNIQVYETRCEECDKRLFNRVGDMTEDGTIIVDFIDDMEFYCSDCDRTTCIEIEKYGRD